LRVSAVWVFRMEEVNPCWWLIECSVYIELVLVVNKKIRLKF